MPGFSRLRIPRPSDSSEGETGPCYVFDSDSDSDYTSDQLSEVFSSDDEGIHILPSETQLQSSRRRRPPNPNLVAGLASDLGEKAVRPTRAELPIWQSEGQAPGFPPQRRPLRRPSAHMRPYLLTPSAKTLEVHTVPRMRGGSGRGGVSSPAPPTGNYPEVIPVRDIPPPPLTATTSLP